MPLSLSNLKRPVAFVWRVGNGASNKLDQVAHSRLAVSVTSPLAVAVLATNLQPDHSLFRIAVSVASTALWGTIWLRPFKGVRFQQVLPSFLSEQKKIIKACRRGDLATLTRLRNPDFNFSFLGKFDRVSRHYSTVTPLSEAITHQRWEVVDWLFHQQGLLFGEQLFNGINKTKNDPFSEAVRNPLLPYIFIKFTPNTMWSANPVPQSPWEQYVAAAPAASVAHTLVEVARHLPGLDGLLLVGSLVKRAWFNPTNQSSGPELYRALLRVSVLRHESLFTALDAYSQDQTCHVSPKLMDLISALRATIYKTDLEDNLPSNTTSISCAEHPPKVRL